MKINLLLVLFLLCMTGCTSQDDAANDTREQPETESTETERERPTHVLKTQMEQLDKARDLQDQMNQSVIDRVNAIDQTAKADDDEDN